MKTTVAALLTLTFALGACAISSPEVRHFQLSAGPLTASSVDGPGIYVERVSMPDFLLRSEILMRDDEYTVHYDATQRWAEPLDLGIQRVILRQLGGQFGAGRLAAFPKPPNPNTQWRLRVEISRFEAQGSRAVLAAEGRWTLVGATPEAGDEEEQRSVVVSFTDELALASTTGSEIAAALSELLAKFSRELADAVTIK